MHRSRIRFHLMPALLGSVLLVLTGCIPASFANTPFQQKAGDAASLMVAAATSIELAQTGELDVRYARSSLRIYRDQLAAIPGFGGLRGAPDDVAMIGTFDAAVASAIGLLSDPCLDNGCDWRGQVRSLSEAGRVLDEAAS
jgi:hypothetical protein